MYIRRIGWRGDVIVMTNKTALFGPESMALPIAHLPVHPGADLKLTTPLTQEICK